MSKKSERVQLQGNCDHSIEAHKGSRRVYWRCTRCFMSFSSEYLDFELKHKFGLEGFTAEKARLNQDKRIFQDQIEVERRSNKN